MSIAFLVVYWSSLFPGGVGWSEPLEVPQLELSVHLDDEEYTLSSLMKIGVVVTNNGDHSVAIWNVFEFGLPGTLELLVLDSIGKPVPQHVIFEPEFGASLSPELLILNPGESTRSSHHFIVRELVAGPGEYTLRIEYFAPDVEYTSDAGAEVDAELWDRDAGRLGGSKKFRVLPPVEK